MNGAVQRASAIVMRQAATGVGVESMKNCLLWSDVLEAVNKSMPETNDRLRGLLCDASVPETAKAMAALAAVVREPWRVTDADLRCVMFFAFRGFAGENSAVPVAAWRVCEDELWRGGALRTCEDVTGAARAVMHGVLQAWTTGKFVAHEAKRVRMHDAVYAVAIEVMYMLVGKLTPRACQCASAILIDVLRVHNPVATRDPVAVALVEALVCHGRTHAWAEDYRRMLESILLQTLEVVLDPATPFCERTAALACDAMVKHLCGDFVRKLRRTVTIPRALEILQAVVGDEQQHESEEDESVADTDSQDESVADTDSQDESAVDLAQLKAQAEQVYRGVRADGDVDAEAADVVARKAPVRLAAHYAQTPGSHRRDFLAVCLVLDLSGLGEMYPDAETMCDGLDESFVDAVRHVRAQYSRMSTPPKNLHQARQRWVNMFFDNLDDAENRFTKFQMACIMYAHQGTAGADRRVPDQAPDHAFQQCLLLPFAALGQKGLTKDKSRPVGYVRHAVDQVLRVRPTPRRVVVLHLGLGEYKTVANSLDDMAQKMSQQGAGAPCAVVHVEYNACLVLHDWARVNDMVMRGARILMMNAESVRVRYAAHTARNAYVVTAWRLRTSRPLRVDNIFQRARELPAVVFMMYAQRIAGLDTVDSQVRTNGLPDVHVAHKDTGGHQDLLRAVLGGLKRKAPGGADDDERPRTRFRAV